METHGPGWTGTSHRYPGRADAQGGRWQASNEPQSEFKIIVTFGSLYLDLLSFLKAVVLLFNYITFVPLDDFHVVFSIEVCW